MTYCMFDKGSKKKKTVYVQYLFCKFDCFISLDRCALQMQMLHFLSFSHSFHQCESFYAVAIIKFDISSSIK